MKDSDLNRLAHTIVSLTPVIDYPRNKVGAIQRFPKEVRENIKLLKSKHFQQPIKK